MACGHAPVPSCQSVQLDLSPSLLIEVLGSRRSATSTSSLGARMYTLVRLLLSLESLAETP